MRVCMLDSAWCFLFSALRSIAPPKCVSIATGLLICVASTWKSHFLAGLPFRKIFLPMMARVWCSFYLLHEWRIPLVHVTVFFNSDTSHPVCTIEYFLCLSLLSWCLFSSDLGHIPLLRVVENTSHACLIVHIRDCVNDEFTCTSASRSSASEREDAAQDAGLEWFCNRYYMRWRALNAKLQSEEDTAVTDDGCCRTYTWLSAPVGVRLSTTGHGPTWNRDSATKHQHLLLTCSWRVPPQKPLIFWRWKIWRRQKDSNWYCRFVNHTKNVHLNAWRKLVLVIVTSAERETKFFSKTAAEVLGSKIKLVVTGKLMK